MTGTNGEPTKQGERRGIRMTDDEAWAFVTDAHTGILTTLRADGYPIALPIWFAVVDRTIYVSTRGKKVSRAARDQRCSFLVEQGDMWAELRAVHFTAVAQVLDHMDDGLADRVHSEMERKYSQFRTASAAMPSATRRHYASQPGSTIALTPHGRVISWDNRRLGIGS